MSVFLSATLEDQAYFSLAVVSDTATKKNGVPVAMTLDSYQPASLPSLNLAAGCSHFIGFYTPLRGWCPPSLGGQSLLEAERKVAIKGEKKIAYILPHPLSDLHKELRERSQKTEPNTYAQAQEQFLQDVRQHLPFLASSRDEALGLACAVCERFCVGRLGSIAPRSGKPGPDLEMALTRLGHKEQERTFEQTREYLLNPKSPRLACLLIHGPPGHGATRLAHRLRDSLANDSHTWVQPPIPVDVRHRNGSLAELRRVLLRLLNGSGRPHGTSAELKTALVDTLQTKHLLLTLEGIQELKGSLETFARDFWQPLASMLRGKIRRSLVVLLTFEGALPPSCANFLQEPPGENADLETFDSLRIVQLPGLKPFRVSDVVQWLEGFSECSDPAALAEAIIHKFPQGSPADVYLELHPHHHPRPQE